MLLDTYFHLIWCYFVVVIWAVQGWSGDVYFFCLFYLALTFYLKLNQNYSKIPCSIDMKSKQQNKICVYQNKICGFLLQNTYNYFYPPKTVCLMILFPKTPIFGQSQVTSSWFKTNKNSKFKPTMFHDQSLS
jgi:hypothetical protein